MNKQAGDDKEFWRGFNDCLAAKKHRGREPQVFELPVKGSLPGPAHLRSLQAQGIRTVVIVPLVLGEQNLGFLELHFQSSTQFTSGDLELVQCAGAVLCGYRAARGSAGSSLESNKLRAKRALSQMQKLARSGLEGARRSVQALRPKALDGTALSDALGQAAVRLREETKLSCQFKELGKRVNLSAETQSELFRIAQEALTNVVKHADAKSVCITLQSGPRRVSLSIKDDGIGLATAKRLNPCHGFGMGSMRERAQGIGGRLRVESRPGRGTTVRVEVPWPARERKRK